MHKKSALFVLILAVCLALIPLPVLAAEEPGMFAKILGGLMSGIPQAIIDTLHLKDFQGLVFGQSGFFNFFDKNFENTGPLKWGVFEAKTYNNVIKPIQSVFRALAWTVALLMIYLAALQMARSGANSSRRLKMYASLENWIVGSLLIGSSGYLLDVIFGISNGIVAALAPPAGTMVNFINYTVPTGPGNFLEQTLITPLMMVAIIGVLFALNFIYLQRYFVLIILTAMAPVFGVMWFSDKTRHIFENWFKEIICLAAMPITHALFFYIYTKLAIDTPSMLLQLFFLILMVPMSDMMRGMLGAGGSGKSVSDNLLLGMGMGASMGLANSLMGLGKAAVGGGGGVMGGSVASIANANVGASSNNFGPPQGGTPLAQVMGNSDMISSLRQRVDFGRTAGSKVGRVFGGVSGAVFGAAMGNNMATAMGSMIGSHSGDAVGQGLGGAVAIADMQFRDKFNPEAAGDFYSNLGQPNIMQAQVGPDGAPVWQREPTDGVTTTPGVGRVTGSNLGGTGANQGAFVLDSNGHRVPVLKPVVNPELAQEFGRANFDSVKAYAYSGIPMVGAKAAQKAAQSNAMATTTAQSSLPNPVNVAYSEGDMLQKVTTNSGSHFYKLGQEGARQYVYSTAEMNPLASAQNPWITESRFVVSKEGDLTEKVVRQGFSGNFATARGTQPALILNNMLDEK